VWAFVHNNSSLLRLAPIKLYFIIERAFVGGEDLPHVADEFVLVEVAMHNRKQRLGKVAPAPGTVPMLLGLI